MAQRLVAAAPLLITVAPRIIAAAAPLFATRAQRVCFFLPAGGLLFIHIYIYN